MKGYYAGNEYWERYVLLNNAYKKTDPHGIVNRQHKIKFYKLKIALKRVFSK